MMRQQRACDESHSCRTHLNHGACFEKRRWNVVLSFGLMDTLVPKALAVGGVNLLPVAADQLAFEQQTIGFVAMASGMALLVAMLLLLLALSHRRKARPYLLIHHRRFVLSKGGALDHRYWPEVTDATVDEAQARIVPYDESYWVVTVQPSGIMRVDGLRSQRNRLQNGAYVTLGQAGQAAFTFIDPRENKPASGRAGRR